MLKGRCIDIMISEPWDFAFPSGSNETAAQVLDTSEATDEKQWLLCQVDPFPLGGSEVAWFLIARRYEDQQVISELLDGRTITANLVFRPNEPLPSREQIDRLLVPTNTEWFLIGSIALHIGVTAGS